MADQKTSFPPDPSQRISAILYRRKVMIVGIFLICFSLIALLIQSIQPVYMAKAQIAFNGEDETYVTTQEHYIKSLSMARQVVAGLNLFNDADLIEGQAPQDHSKFKSLNLNAPNEEPVEKSLSRDHAALLHKVLEPLNVSHLPHSYILELSYTDHTPEKATRILSAFIRHYVANRNIDYINQQPQQDSNDDWSISLKEELNDIRDTVAALKSTQSSVIAAEQHNDNEAAYQKTSQKYSVLKTQLTPFLNAEGQLVRNPDAPAITSSAVIQNLTQEQRAQQAKLDTLFLRYGDKHPLIRNAKSEIALITTQIDQENDAIMSRIKADYDRTKIKLSALDSAAQPPHNDLDTLRYGEKLNNIETSLSGAETAVTQLEINTLPSTVLDFARTLNVNVITPATMPLRPIYPNRLSLVGLSFLFSLFIAIAIVVLIEKNRKTFLNGRQLEATLNQPCYGLVPKVTGDQDKALADFAMDHPDSDLAEAMRTLHLNIKLRTNSKGKEGQVVAITSSKPNEGKTTLCSWLARIAAKSGTRVLLIDADLRKPSIHTSLGTKNTLSLVDYLSGRNKLEDVIDKTVARGLHVLYGRSVPNSALDLMSSRKMDKLIAVLKQEYDLIIIDTPACMAVSDARAIQKNSDLLLYVVAWHKTRREVVHSGISQFLKFGTPRIATVLSHIDVKKHVQLGYGEVVSDYGAYKPV